MNIVKVLVSGTSVLIDLERGSLLRAGFHLPFAFAVPGLLCRQELGNHGGTPLLALGLTVEELDGNEVALALNYGRRRRSLSLPDGFVLALAKAGSWILLTGDGGLRQLAREEGGDCYGVLWLPTGCSRKPSCPPASRPSQPIPDADCRDRKSATATASIPVVDPATGPHTPPPPGSAGVPAGKQAARPVKAPPRRQAPPHPRPTLPAVPEGRWQGSTPSARSAAVRVAAVEKPGERARVDGEDWPVWR